jgi:hypothetical protein
MPSQPQQQSRCPCNPKASIAALIAYAFNASSFELSLTAVSHLTLQPFLAPPYPWTCDYAGREECFSRVEQWGSRPAWLKPADAMERSAIRQWLFAVRRGLNQKQLQAYQVRKCLPPQAQSVFDTYCRLNHIMWPDHQVADLLHDSLQSDSEATHFTHQCEGHDWQPGV